MSKLVIPVGGLKLSLAEQILAWQGASLGLFVQPWTPSISDTLVNYLAIEATFPGYQREPVYNWSPPVQDGNTPPGVVSAAVPCLFRRSLSGPVQNVYGVFMVDAVGNLRWAQVDDNAPVPLSQVGDPYTWTPTWDRQYQT